MELRLFFIEQPSPSVLELLDRRIGSLACRQESIEGGRRLWITHIPETSSRPFLHARPFDIYVKSVRLSRSEIEEFRMGIGIAPVRCMICRSRDDDVASCEVLFAIVAEVISICHALLEIPEHVGRKMFHIASPDDDFDPRLFADFPGTVHEIAHETEEGDLMTVWLVDARWIRAFLAAGQLLLKAQKLGEFSRFSTLDYA